MTGLTNLLFLRYFPMAKAIILLALISLNTLGLPSTVLASKPLLCQPIENHQVCVLSIKRSAKNFWEYRVQLSVDGEPQAKERYDCRRTLRPLATDQKPSPQQLHWFVCGLPRR